uniref:Uncharacterized protein n=1 Tax=Arundo donax TaxID=35708 RepID=A0A0A9G008_ARUDO
MMLMSVDPSQYNRTPIDKHLLVCQNHITNAYLARLTLNKLPIGIFKENNKSI